MASSPPHSNAWANKLNMYGFLVGNQQENEAAPDSDDDDESIWDAASDVSDDKWLRQLNKEPQTDVRDSGDSLKQHSSSSPTRMKLAQLAACEAPAEIKVETAVKSPNLDTSSRMKVTPNDSGDLTETTSSSDESESSTPNQSISQKKRQRLFAIVFTIIFVAVIILVATLSSGGGRNSSQAPTPATPVETGSSGVGGAVDSSGDESTPPPQETDPHVDAPAPEDTNPDEDAPPEETNPHDDAPPESDNPSMPSLGPITYVPGLLTVEENGLLLSQGLTSRRIATRRQPVEYANGSFSIDPFHRRPDYGACFPVPSDVAENQGGWVYVSNSELGGPPSGQGGVGALYFDKDGNITDYKMLLTGTTTNCAGGRTPWGTFVSCEEVEDIGQVYQVDPFDRRPPERISLGSLGGRYESFAYDDRNKSTPRFFVTEDLKNGPTVRWTPDPTDSLTWDWDLLTGNGTLEYLFLNPDPADNNSSGTFEWTTNLTSARANAELYARGTEGIDRNGEFLYFVCKTESLFYILDLDRMTFVMYPANVGLFDGQPDQVKRMVNDTQDILYFTEAGSAGISGVHGRNSKGQYFTILEGPRYKSEETTGLAFSPNGLHMYIAFQDPGVLFDITRTDGYPFHGLSLEVNYHNPPLDHLLKPY